MYSCFRCEVSLDESQVPAKRILKLTWFWIDDLPEQSSSWASSVRIGSEGMVSLNDRNFVTETEPMVPMDESSIYWGRHFSKQAQTGRWAGSRNS